MLLCSSDIIIIDRSMRKEPCKFRIDVVNRRCQDEAFDSFVEQLFATKRMLRRRFSIVRRSRVHGGK